jgi:hypothetical protein
LGCQAWSVKSYHALIDRYYARIAETELNSEDSRVKCPTI